MENQKLYQVFYNELLKQIKSGELKNGQRLPTERDLCTLYGISRTTVREALKNLEMEGHLIRRQGSGTFVKIKPIEQHMKKLFTLRERFIEQGIKHYIKILNFKERESPEHIAKELNIGIGETIIELIRLFYAADVPYTIEYTYLPKKLVPEITEDMIVNDGLYCTLENLGKKPTGAVETIRTSIINKEQMKYLKLHKNEIAIETSRVTKSEDTIIEYTKNII
ncbi:MAG: GntR family transcriptional regulator, partial [Treponema sp.]|nr:GntR family transcriptional regulator [Treponema sp.]